MCSAYLKGWSLDARDWHKLAHALPESAWRHVRFRQINQDSIPTAPGVYAVCAGPALVRVNQPENLFSALLNVLYVGQTANLRRRFLEHLAGQKPEMAALLDCYEDAAFWFITLPNQRLNNVERELINCFGPPANRQQGIAGRIGPAEPA